MYKNEIIANPQKVNEMKNTIDLLKKAICSALSDYIKERRKNISYNKVTGMTTDDLSKQCNLSVVFKQVCIDFYYNSPKEMRNIAIEQEEIAEYLVKSYVSLVGYLNRYLIYAPSKIDFCMFANLNSLQYHQALSGELASPAIRNHFIKMEDYIVDILQKMAQLKQLDKNAVEMVLQTYGVRGHNQATTSTVATSITQGIGDRYSSTELIKQALSATAFIENPKDK